MLLTPGSWLLTLQRKHCFIAGQEQSIAAPSRQKSDPPVRLAMVGLKAERQLAIPLDQSQLGRSRRDDWRGLHDRSGSSGHSQRDESGKQQYEEAEHLHLPSHTEPGRLLCRLPLLPGSTAVSRF